MKIQVGFLGMDQIEIDVVKKNMDEIESIHWRVVGRLELVELCRKWSPKMKGAVAQIPIPVDKNCESLLLKKLILILQNKWPISQNDVELCHCRKIPQSHVERAIVLGSRKVEEVRQQTSANTSCGTCLPDVQSVLQAYLT